MAKSFLDGGLKCVVMAVGAARELGDGPESWISWGAVRKRRKTALAHRLVTIHLRCVWLIHGACADILGAQINRVSDLVFDTKTPSMK